MIDAMSLHLILCFGCVSLVLKLLFQLLLKDLQRLVLQVKLLRQGDLSHTTDLLVFTLWQERSQIW